MTSFKSALAQRQKHWSKKAALQMTFPLLPATVLLGPKNIVQHETHTNIKKKPFSVIFPC